MLKSRERIQEIRRKDDRKFKVKGIPVLKVWFEECLGKKEVQERERKGTADIDGKVRPLSLSLSFPPSSFFPLDLSCFLGEIILEWHLQWQAGSSWTTRACLTTRLESSPSTFCPRSQRTRTNLLLWLSVCKVLKVVVSQLKIQVVERPKKQRTGRIDLDFDIWFFVSFFAGKTTVTTSLKQVLSSSPHNLNVAIYSLDGE